MSSLLSLFDNLWSALAFAEGAAFFLAAVYFAVKPEKSSFLISSYSSLSAQNRACYDLCGLGRYVSRVLTLLGVICLAGAIAALLLGGAAYWIATAAWIITAALTLRVDHEKLLRRFRKE